MDVATSNRNAAATAAKDDDADNSSLSKDKRRSNERLNRSKRVRKRPRAEQEHPQQQQPLVPGWIVSLDSAFDCVGVAATEALGTKAADTAATNDNTTTAASSETVTSLRADQPEQLVDQPTATRSLGLVRIIPPYPYTFFSFCKQRWIGRTVLDVYATEFGSYPVSYYNMAIQQGRIQVSDQVVGVEHVLRGADVLQHTVHRHEPAVAVSTNKPPYLTIVGETDTLLAIDKPSTIPVHPCGGYHRNSVMKLLEEEALRSKSNDATRTTGDDNGNGKLSYDKLYTIHRLDRLTSGLLVLAKTSAAAKEWGHAIQQRDCQKIYLARVKGRFCYSNPRLLTPVNATSATGTVDDSQTPESIPFLLPEQRPLYGEYPQQHNVKSGANAVSNDENDLRSRMAHGYWLADSEGGPIAGGTTDQSNHANNVVDVQLQEFATAEHSVDEWLKDINVASTVSAIQSTDDTLVCGAEDMAMPQRDEDMAMPQRDEDTTAPLVWLHLACPVRIEQPKIGICAAGLFDDLDAETYKKTVKPAQTAFGVVHYNEADDSTLLIVRPLTGRTHQIRIHLQYLGHCIANDPNYGGTLWFGYQKGEHACARAQSLLNQHQQPFERTEPLIDNDDGVKGDAGEVDGTRNDTCSASRVMADEPATEEEVQQMHQTSEATTRDPNEDVADFIQRTCVWCARHKGQSVSERAMLEFLVRSPGLWLHALQYKVKTLSFRTELPKWSRF